MDDLKKRLNLLIEKMPTDKKRALRERLENLISVYPFNEYEYVISTLMGYKNLTLDEYYLIRDEYVARNMYLYIFEIGAPRGFGEQWAQGHLKGLVPNLVKPTKKLDKNYAGDYDFVLPWDGKIIRIEVKASRAVDGGSAEPLYVKALSYESKHPFWMNFQQIKPAHTDVFVWIAVWRDLIKYWVLSSDEVKANRYYSKGQHRGNVGEGQLHIKEDNIREFKSYEVRSDKLLSAIIKSFKRQRKLK